MRPDNKNWRPPKWNPKILADLKEVIHKDLHTFSDKPTCWGDATNVDPCPNEVVWWVPHLQSAFCEHHANRLIRVSYRYEWYSLNLHRILLKKTPHLFQPYRSVYGASY